MCPAKRHGRGSSSSFCSSFFCAQQSQKSDTVVWLFVFITSAEFHIISENESFIFPSPLSACVFCLCVPFPRASQDTLNPRRWSVDLSSSSLQTRIAAICYVCVNVCWASVLSYAWIPTIVRLLMFLYFCLLICFLFSFFPSLLLSREWPRRGRQHMRALCEKSWAVQKGGVLFW